MYLSYHVRARVSSQLGIPLDYLHRLTLSVRRKEEPAVACNVVTTQPRGIRVHCSALPVIRLVPACHYSTQSPPRVFLDGHRSPLRIYDSCPRFPIAHDTAASRVVYAPLLYCLPLIRTTAHHPSTTLPPPFDERRLFNSICIPFKLTTSDPDPFGLFISGGCHSECSGLIHIRLSHR